MMPYCSYNPKVYIIFIFFTFSKQKIDLLPQIIFKKYLQWNFQEIFTDIIKGSDKERKKEREGENYFSSLYREGGRERLRKGREEGRNGGRKEEMKDNWSNHRENLSIFACWLRSPSIIQMEHKNLYYMILMWKYLPWCKLSLVFFSWN